MKLFPKPSAYTTILNRLSIIDADPSLGEGRWTREEETTNELFKMFKLAGHMVPADKIDAVFAKAKADPLFGKGGLTYTEELANELAKLWRAAKPPEPLLLTKRNEVKAAE
jgi:hypothetical protein